MARYAQSTEVGVDRSRAEIERTLIRYGADGFTYGWDGLGGAAMLGFRFRGRAIRFVLPLPDRNDAQFTTTETGRDRTAAAARKAWEQATRQRWRALSLTIKAKLEVVESGIREFDQEFGLDVVLPDGRTVGEHVLPGLDKALRGGPVPRLLGLPPASSTAEG